MVFLPFLDGGEAERNALVAALGAPLASYFLDLFLSPCGGPNVRAAVAHGVGRVRPLRRHGGRVVHSHPTITPRPTPCRRGRPPQRSPPRRWPCPHDAKAAAALN